MTYLVFDVLYVDGKSAMVLPYRERRALLEELELVGPAWYAPAAFEDGDALYEVVCDQGLEGVVAKRLSSTYQPNARGWLKTKNPTYWRLAAEREGFRSRVAPQTQPVLA